MYSFENPLEISDFSKGVTDNYIEGGPSEAQTVDNLLVQKNSKLKSRPGRTFYISAAQAQITAGNSRVSALIKHVVNRQILAQSAAYLNYNSSGTWTSLLGPVSSNTPLGSTTTSNFASWSDYKGHTFITTDAFPDVVKVYRDQNAAYQVRTAGLPRVDLEGAIDLANSIKSKFNSHRADVGAHLTLADTVNVINATDAYDEATLITLTNQIVTKYAAHNADAALAASWVYHDGQNSTSHTLSSTTTATTIDQCITLLDDIKTKFNGHDADSGSHGTTSNWQVTVVRSPAITSAAGTATYLYKFLYYYSYFIDDVQWEDFGPTYQVTHSSAGTGTKSIASIPAIANGTTRCYDTANITCKIYRTVDGGTTFYYVGQVTNGTTTYSDTTSDATLQTSTQLYTAGGVLDNDPPPKCKYLTVVNDVGVYANLKIGSANYPNSFITSIPGDVDSVPGSFQDEVELPITGISSIGVYPIVFCRNRFYRLEGSIDEQGRGTVLKREVSRVKGCISNNSIVQIPEGLVFAGEDGFYFTDGYSVQPISIHLVETYKEIVATSANETRIYGEYDSQENRVYWCCNLDSSVSENDSIFVLDLNYGLSPKSVYTTMSGVSTSMRPSALAFYQNTMLQGDSRGYVFKFSASTATDPKVNTAVSASSWEVYPIIYNYKSSALNFGTNDRFKFIPTITLESRNDVNATIQIKSNNNNSGQFTTLKEVRSRSLITWGDASIPWNPADTNYPWNVSKIIIAKRRFPQGEMRCLLKQIQITNAFTNIYNSDTYGSATVDSSAKTATISGTFPTDIVDYYISFDTDTYTNNYLITARNSGTVLTYTDSNNTTTTGTKKWLIRGYKKGELVYLISYGIRYAFIGQIQTPWRGDDGTNA